MLKPMIRTMNGWGFELPLALVLGAAVAFATIAMPHGLFVRFPGMAKLGGGEMLQVSTGALVALLAVAGGYLAMRRPPVQPVADPIADDEDVYDSVSPDTPVRLRRADAHPDNPPRQPIRAARDLGAPFMEVAPFEKRLVAETPSVVDAPIADGEFVEISEPDTVADEAAVEHAEAAEPRLPSWFDPAPAREETPFVPAPEIDSTPELVAEAAPAPEAVHDAPIADLSRAAERAPRETLAQMMERLSAGIERRAGVPVAPPPASMLAEVLARPRAARPELRDAVEELNRLAGRRD